MRNVPTSLEIIGYAVLSIAGFVMIYEGMTNQLAALLLGGSLCITLGVITLVYAIKNALWHWNMLHRSVRDEKCDTDS
jgi:hypothetical protein